ncbi:T9SS type A sorting domain-containing protein [Mangrovimonas futianensis]|uniref:T9SS type A sorting domain-containing protein n=1 Tax=Mangrovimonas futianensis TaxID=2895523 RepID=UPI001E35928F|nr:T9SS type A sorting domain-containing protein [Mangrovimonas futianensis]MCF1420792.1 T9SS type A sorting domain-containing protein [Mangrovimonas futianensis]
MKKKPTLIFSFFLFTLLGFSQTETLTPNGGLTSNDITYINFTDPNPRTRSLATAILPLLSSGATEVQFVLKGGDGGAATWDGAFVDLGADGGQGATLYFTLPITPENEGQLITFYQGKHGESYSHGLLASGGGGGSTGVRIGNNVIAVASGGGGGCATEIIQSAGLGAGESSNDGIELYCYSGNSSINASGYGRSIYIFDVISLSDGSITNYFIGNGGGGGFNANNISTSYVNRLSTQGKAFEEGGFGGYNVTDTYMWGENCDYLMPNPFLVYGCDAITGTDASAGGAGFSGGGAGGVWYDGLSTGTVCGGTNRFAGGGGGAGYGGGGGGGNHSGGGGGRSYTHPNMLNDFVISGTTTDSPENGYVSYQVIYDTQNPNAVCQDTSVTLGYGNYYTGIAGQISLGQGIPGQATLSPNAIDGGSTDNTAISSISASQLEFTCDNLGTNAITLTVTDSMGLTDTCTATVTVIDDHAPGLTTESHNLISSPTFGLIDLGNSASMTINPPVLTFVDNCAVYSPSIQQAQSFTVTCSDIGQTITKEVKASDTSGNERTFYLNYTITATPTAFGHDIIRWLDNTGQVTITPQDVIDTGTFSDCFIYSLDKTTFSCQDVGENAVTLTVTNTLTNESDSVTVTVIIEPFSLYTTTLYVDANSPTETGNGYSWSEAFRSLDEALEIQKCRVIDEIKVASGTYYPSTSRDCDNCSSEREYYFLMNTDFELRGSYNPATGEQDYNNPSILNGDLGVIGDMTDNAFHVFMTQGLSDQAIIDGFVIQNGNANGSTNITVASFSNPPYQGNGGGIYNDMSNAIFSNIFLYNNSANNGGGGMINLYESPQLINMVFANNHSNTNGGGLYNYFSGPTIINNTIYGNTAIQGGGVYNDHNVSESIVTTFYNTVLYNNSSDITNYLTIISANSSHNYSENYTGNGFVTLTSDPFIDAFNFIGDDFIPGTMDDGLLPSLSSPLINAGDNTYNTLTTDITGNDRFNEGIIDVGAYEYNSCFTYASGVIFVDVNALGANNGSTWTDAFISLDDALIEAKACNNVLEIRVAGGTYTPTSSRACTNCGTARETYFLIDQDIIIKGGYNPITEIFDVNTPTILSGNIGASSNSDNTYHVLITQNLTANAVIDGFIINDGNANGTGNNFINALPLLKNYGGGIYNINSSPTYQNIVVSNNASSFAGGGVYNQNNSQATFINAIITGNTSSSGGGMHNTQSSPMLINLTVVGNSAPSGGGGILNFTSASPLIYNSVFYNNGIDITNFNGSVNGNSSHNFSATYGGTGFTVLNANPFVDYGNAIGYDGLWKTEDDGLIQTLDAILIDAGNSNFNPLGLDIKGDNRFLGNAIDVGAYEIEGSTLNLDDNLFSNANISVYPNPAESIITIKNDTHQKIETFELYDLTGRLIKTIRFGENQESYKVDLSEINQSTYMVIITSKNFKVTKMLIKK